MVIVICRRVAPLGAAIGLLAAGPAFAQNCSADLRPRCLDGVAAADGQAVLHDDGARFQEAKARRGDVAILFSWGGVDWAFKTLANRDAFAVNPRHWDITGGLRSFHSSRDYAIRWRREFGQRRRVAEEIGEAAFSDGA